MKAVSKQRGNHLPSGDDLLPARLPFLFYHLRSTRTRSIGLLITVVEAWKEKNVLAAIWTISPV
jgi:hypothetical protein